MGIDTIAGWAWAAGIIDGEGTIRFTRQPQTRAPGRFAYFAHMIVGNTDVRMLQRMSELFGGKVYPMNHSVPRTLDGRTIHSRKPMWQWTVSGPRAMAAIRAIEPYLVVKREIAQVILEYQPGRPGLRVTDEEIAHRESLMQRITDIRKAG